MSYPELSHGKIVAVEWRTAGRNVCFVAVNYEEYWQAYVTSSDRINYGRGIIVEEMPEVTEKYCTEHGAKLSWKEAAAFFPMLNITKYKTYPYKTYDEKDSSSRSVMQTPELPTE